MLLVVWLADLKFELSRGTCDFCYLIFLNPKAWYKYGNTPILFSPLGFCFIVWKGVVLKISITLSLENQKPTETDWNWNTPKPIDFQPFRSVSAENFTNRLKPNQEHPYLVATSNKKGIKNFNNFFFFLFFYYKEWYFHFYISFLFE